jgi:hypothetical protein
MSESTVHTFIISFSGSLIYRHLFRLSPNLWTTFLFDTRTCRVTFSHITVATVAPGWVERDQRKNTLWSGTGVLTIAATSTVHFISIPAW